MSNEYTKEELDEFDRLTNDASDRDQMTRIRGRLDLRKFVDTHGKEKCDAMFAALKEQPHD